MDRGGWWLQSMQSVAESDTTEPLRLSLSSSFMLPFFVEGGSNNLHFIFAVVESLSCSRLFEILCNPMDCSTPDFPVLHYLPEFVQVHVH